MTPKSNQQQGKDPQTSQSEQLNTGWIKNGIDEQAIKWAEEFGKELNTGNDKQKLSTSQLRKFFGAIRRLQSKGFNYNSDKREILRLKPMLAYAKGKAEERNKGNKIALFYQEISKAIDAVKDENTFTNFIDLVEAIVAYHKAAGGK